jgi:ATP synthase F1 complex assembly factor 2
MILQPTSREKEILQGGVGLQDRRYMKCSNGVRLSSSDPHIHAEGYGVLLGHRKLRTPRRELLVLPTEPLALAVAGEWASQGSLLQPSIMHLTSLCNTVVDNPHHRSRSSSVDTILPLLHTDTVLYRQEEQEDLFALQSKEWDPLVNWFNQRFCTKLQPSTSLDPPSLPPSLLSSVSLYLSQLDNWTLQGFWYAVQSCHSVIITSALMEGHLNVDSAVNLSRLEIRHQVDHWGSVEWQHDVEHQDLRSRLAASHLMAQLANWTV